MKKQIIVIFVAVIVLLGYFFLSEPAVAPTASQETEAVEKDVSDAVESDETTVSDTENASSSNYKVENITVKTESLGDGQQKLLKTFGVEGDVEITPEMIACAEEKIDKIRLDEIIAGATPTFLEGLALASCY